MGNDENTMKMSEQEQSLSENVNGTEQNTGKKFKLSKKLIIILAVVLGCVVLVAAALLGYIFLKPSSDVPILGVINDNNELDLYNLKTTAVIETSEEFNQSFGETQRGGQYIYFVNADDELMRIDTKNKKSEPLEIDDEIESYSISLDGRKCFYLKKENLYCFNGKTSEKIARNVYSYITDLDGKSLLYFDEDDTLYQLTVGKEPVRLQKQVEQIINVDLKTSTVYYARNGKIYSVDPSSKEPVELLGNTKDMTSLAVLDDGTLLYTKNEMTEIAYSTITENDITLTDIKDPVSTADLTKQYSETYSYEQCLTLFDEWYASLSEDDKSYYDGRIEYYLNSSWYDYVTREDVIFDQYESIPVISAIYKKLTQEGFNLTNEEVKYSYQDKSEFEELIEMFVNGEEIGMNVAFDYEYIDNDDGTKSLISDFVYFDAVKLSAYEKQEDIQKINAQREEFITSVQNDSFEIFFCALHVYKRSGAFDKQKHK